MVRGSNQPDGVIDFDEVSRDPANSSTFRAAVGSTDRLHPDDFGYKLMGDSVDLKLFEKELVVTK